MDHQEFSQAMMYLSAAYGTEISKERAAVYWDQLGNLEATLLMEAVKAYVNRHRHFPTVAELRQCYREALSRRSSRATRRLPEAGTADREHAREMIRRARRALRG